jgi:integrase
VQIDFRRGRWSPATQAAYESNWRDFAIFCGKLSVPALPALPSTVAAFLAARAESHSTSAISQRLAAIRAAHKEAGSQFDKLDPQRNLYTLDDPIITDAWKELCREKGTASTPKAALTKKELRKMLVVIPAERLQDRALVLLAYKSAMRRSEIVALNVADLEFGEDALLITIRRSKTDKTGKGQVVAVLRSEGATCAVAALEAHLAEAGISAGAVFRTRTGARLLPERVAYVTKRWAKAIGVDPRTVGAHSWRHGCITDMNRAGVNLKDGMSHSRHATASIYLGYVENETARRNPAIKALAL